jgi:HK97 family phage portal protein
MTQTAADKLKAKWLENHGGDRRSIAVLNSTTEFVPINLSPVDAALDQVKRLNVADVAYAFGLDPMTLGAGLNNSATYTNLRDAWENHRDFGLGPWIAAVQDTLSALLPGSQTVTVNLDGFANPGPAERFAAYTTALAAGILTLDEVRALEGLPPLESGSVSAP